MRNVALVAPLFAALAGCLTDPNLERGTGHLMSVPQDYDAPYGTITRWEVYRDDGGLVAELRFEGQDDAGNVQAFVVLRTAIDGTTEVGAVTPDQAGSMLLDAEGGLVSSSLVATPELDVFANAALASFAPVAEEAGLVCTACSAGLLDKVSLEGILGATAVGCFTAVLAGLGCVDSLGVWLPACGVAVAGGSVCVAGVYELVTRANESHQGYLELSRFDAVTGVRGTWQRQDLRVSTPHPAPLGATLRYPFLCPAGATWLRIGFDRIAFDTFGSLTIETAGPDQTPTSAFFYELDHTSWTSPGVIGDHGAIVYTTAASRQRVDPYGFDAAFLECFIPQSR